MAGLHVTMHPRALAYWLASLDGMQCAQAGRQPTAAEIHGSILKKIREGAVNDAME